MATEDWFGIVIIRIQRPSTRIWFTALKDCEPPDTCITASVRPCVGRTAPPGSGIQSIWDFITPLIAPWRSGLVQTCPSDHSIASRSSCDLGVLGRRVVRQRQAVRMIDARLARPSLEQALAPPGSAAGCRSARRSEP